MRIKLLFFLLLILPVAVSINAQTDPGTAEITHQWTFEDGTGDPTGGVTGVLTGGATVENGYLLINAAGQWLELSGMSIAISGYTALSVATWFTSPAEDVNTGFHMIWYFGGSEVDGVGGTAELGSNGIFFSPARGDNVARTAISCNNIATPWTTESGINRTPEMGFGDSTYHVVTTINDAYISLYVNGVLVDTANLSADNQLANLKDDFAWIGRGGYSGDPNYQSKVHELTMYSKMLSADEVLYLYQHSPVGIREYTNPNAFNANVYAANGIIYIQNTDNVNITSVQVFDMLGKLVYQTNKFEGEISANLPSSVYVVRLESNQGAFVSKVSVQ
jgi:hypothetical protein